MSKTLGKIFFGVVVIISVVIYFKREKILNEKRIYTIGTISKFSETRSSGRRVIVGYKIKGQEYEVSEYRHNRYRIGQKYLVEVPTDHLGFGQTNFDYLLHDSTSCPEGGWNTIPKYLVSQKE